MKIQIPDKKSLFATLVSGKTRAVTCNIEKENDLSKEEGTVGQNICNYVTVNGVRLKSAQMKRKEEKERQHG